MSLAGSWRWRWSRGWDEVAARLSQRYLCGGPRSGAVSYPHVDQCSGPSTMSWDEISRRTASNRTVYVRSLSQAMLRILVRVCSDVSDTSIATVI